LFPRSQATAGLYLLGRLRSRQCRHRRRAARSPNKASALRGIVDCASRSCSRGSDQATRTEWLVYGLPSTGEALGALAGLAIYFGLLGGAGLFDFSRRNL
jgi:hypothetical protein